MFTFFYLENVIGWKTGYQEVWKDFLVRNGAGQMAICKGMQKLTDCVALQFYF